MVFCGINRPLNEFGSSIQEINRNIPINSGGVLEIYKIESLLNLIRRVLPEAVNLKLFFDESKTSQGVLKYFNTEFNTQEISKLGFVIKKTIISNNSSVWEKELIKSDPKKDVHLIFPFSNVWSSSNKTSRVDMQIFANWIIAKTKVPEFSSTSITLNMPFFATVGIHGKDHGIDAGAIASALLSNKPISNRVVAASYARLKINPERAAILGIKVPFDVLAYSQALTNAGLSK